MVRNIVLNFSIILPIVLTSVNAQDADPIEAARQAKLAAEKAAADAEAATGAAIEAAAAKAAAAAREKVIADREAEKARALAEKEAAENAEMDAAAEAAALEARRKLAAELGLEMEEVPDSTIDTELALQDTNSNEEIVSSNFFDGFNLGFTGSTGFINGAFITNLPVGGSLVITTPYGFNIGKSALKLNLSLVLGTYNAEGNNEKINALLYGVGGNLTLIDFIFSESQFGIIGAGLGARSFTGVSLERILNKGLNLPVNVLVGAEGFLTLEAVENQENASYWGGLGVRIDYQF